MSHQQHDAHIGDHGVNPFQHQVPADNLDQSPSSDSFSVESVNPMVPYVARENCQYWFGDIITYVIGPEVLPIPQALNGRHLTRITWFEHISKRVVVID
jgi:hypothetical protein